MKRKRNKLSVDEAVGKLAAALEQSWSKASLEEQAERLKNFDRFMATVLGR